MTADAAPPRSPRRLASSRWAVAVAGAVALAVAMGIGRFAFTPLLPMMLADGVVDLRTASWLASANYLGYLAGALLCTFQPWIWARAKRLPPIDAPRLVRAGLVATGVLTLGMALPWPAAWPALRFGAGIASALVFVYTSGWCLARLASQGASALGGAIYTGPGAGIVVSGLFASGMVAWQWRAATGWLIFGVLAFVLSGAVWRIFRSDPSTPAGAPAAAAAGADQAETRHGRTEIASFTLAYGLAGFGYIVTATFLPVIARQVLPGSPWLDFFWPIFGFGVVGGALLATRLRVSGDLRLLLAGGYVVQAAAIGASVWSPTLTGFALGSLVLGLPFTAITFFAMQEVRRLRPAHAASTMGLLTAMYGIGQIVGPPLVALLLHGGRSAGAGFTLSLEIAAAALLAGAAIYLAMSRV
ncbi:MAG TPA: YbfB/YjiJ family MFS transporter, partial [Caldimonas sp.]